MELPDVLSESSVQVDDGSSAAAEIGSRKRDILFMIVAIMVVSATNVEASCLTNTQIKCTS